METPRIETTGRLHHLVTDQIHLDVEYEEGDHSKSNSIFEEKFYLYHVEDHTGQEISYKQLLNLQEFRSIAHSQILILECPTRDTLLSIQQDFKLHPMIVTETTASVLNVKDDLIHLGEYFLLNLTELPLDAEVQHIKAIKFIYFHNLLIVIHYSPLFSIGSVMCDELYFRALGLKHNNLLKMHREYTKLNGTGCTDLEEILFKFMEAVVSRFETYILKLYSEAKLAIIYSSELKYHSREEFIDRLSMINTSLVSLGDAINQKMHVFSQLCENSILSDSIKISLKNLNSRAVLLHNKVDSIKELEVSSLRLYEAVLYDSMQTVKERSEKLLVKILVVLVMILPLYILPLFWSMNLRLPGDHLENENMWGIVVGCSIALLIIGLTVLKYSKVF